MVFQTVMEFSSLHHALRRPVQYYRSRKPGIQSSGRLAGQSGMSCTPLPILNATIYVGSL